MSLDLPKIRSKFPILNTSIGEYPLCYLDSAATAQKPEAVLEAMDSYYRERNANVHRGMHELAERATVAYEAAREKVANFIGAQVGEVVFTRSCTESLNLVVQGWGRRNLCKGDTVVLSILEHHSNIVPWQMLEKEIGIKIEWIPLDADGRLDLEVAGTIFECNRPKLLSISGHSNVLGTKVPLTELVSLARVQGTLVCVDAAQMIVHQRVDVRDLDCDFLCFSAHKLYGPTGIGVLYAKEEHLNQMDPLLGGGTMIKEVTQEGFILADNPQRFEAGTMPVAEAVGLSAAIDWISQFDFSHIQEHEHTLVEAAKSSLVSITGLTLLPCSDPSSLLSFTLNTVHPHDLTTLLSERGVCMRAGHHCCQPLHDHLGVPASTRLSVGIYNTLEEIERLPEEMERARAILSH